MYTGKYINVICHFLLHIYGENKSKKETINSNEGTMSGKQESRTFKDCYSSHCNPNWHIFLRIGATRLKAISSIRKKENKTVYVFYFLIPLIEKETRLQIQDTRNQTQKLFYSNSARAWCTGKIKRDWVEREVGGGIGMGNTCKSIADSRQCMTKPTTIL